jgi:hypothetical protein
MVNSKLILLVMLIAVSLMVSCVSGIVFEKNAPTGETKIVSGIVKDIRFTSTTYKHLATYMIVFEGGHWLVVGGSADCGYGVDATVQQDVVTQIEFYRNYHLHFVKQTFNWELVQVEEVKTLG